MPFLDSLDLANRALQHCGDDFINSTSEDSKRNSQSSFTYDKVRRAELQRNFWKFAIKRVILRPVNTDTMIIDPALWDATVTYLPGAIVKDTNNMLWVSVEPDNINNDPSGNNEIWDRYFGPLTIAPYDSTTAYWAGELVYLPGAAAGSFVVYQSLQNANSVSPSVATPYSATTTYHRNAVVSSGGSQWRSLIEVNLNNTPADGPLNFDPTATYSTSQTVTGSDHLIYSSVGSGNIGHDPTTDGGVHWTNTTVANAWSRSPTIPVSASAWRVINAQMKNLIFIYPVGAGPVTQTNTRNVFRLPGGFLRTAPQDSKAGSMSYLGTPSGLQYDDWEKDGDYIVSRSVDPIMLRFVADVSRVSAMDDMFCEGLACRIAIAMCSPLSNSQTKLQTIASEYKLFMNEARMVNAIEAGPVEPPVDDWIACRI